MGSSENIISDVERARKLAVLVFSLIIACIFGALSLFLLYNKLEIVEDKNNKLEIELKNYKEELNNTKKLYTDTRDSLLKAQEQCDFFDENLCIVTPTGEKYHTYDCYHWRNSDEIYICTINEADYYGYKPCLDCH